MTSRVTQQALLLAGVAALLPATVAFPASVASEQARSRPFAPPSTPLVLTRTIWRSLYDGKELVVRRRYAVRIFPEGAGFKVAGELIDSAVDAPAPLAALAEMERQRPDSVMFPLHLDARGQILPHSVAPDRTIHHSGGIEALRLIGNSAMDPAGKALASSFINQVIANVTNGQWPTDLFNGAMGERHEQRRIALPGGGEGEVTVSVAVRGQLEAGLPRAIERTVVTELEGTRKVSREQWTLGASSPSSR